MYAIPGYRILKVEPRGEGKFVELRCEAISGGLAETDVPRLYPGGRDLKIKSVRRAADDHLLRIKGIPRSSLLPGAVIISREWPVTESREGLFLHDGGPVPAAAEAVRGGLFGDFNKERFIGRAMFRREGSFLSVRFSENYPMLPGMNCSLLSEDGRPRRLTLLWPGHPEVDEMRRLNAMAKRRPDPHPDAEEAYGRILHVRGFVQMPPGMAEKEWKGAGKAGSWIVSMPELKSLQGRILKLASRPGGAGNAILKVEKRPGELILDIAAEMAAQGTLREENGWYFPPGEARLSPFHRNWLGRVESSGTEGLRLSSMKTGADIEAVEALGRSGLIRGGGELWLSTEAYEELAGILLDGLSTGDVLDMARARKCLGGSRVRTLEMLTLLEHDGKLSSSSGGEGRTVR